MSLLTIYSHACAARGGGRGGGESQSPTRQCQKSAVSSASFNQLNFASESLSCLAGGNTRGILIMSAPEASSGNVAGVLGVPGGAETGETPSAGI